MGKILINARWPEELRIATVAQKTHRSEIDQQITIDLKVIFITLKSSK